MGGGSGRVKRGDYDALNTVPPHIRYGWWQDCTPLHHPVSKNLYLVKCMETFDTTTNTANLRKSKLLIVCIEFFSSFILQRVYIMKRCFSFERTYDDKDFVLKQNSWTDIFVDDSGLLEVSVYGVYITNHVSNTFAQEGGGGVKTVRRVDN